MSRHTAILFLIATGLLWSAIGVLSKLIHWNPISIAGGLSIFAAITQISVTRKFPIFKLDGSAVGASFYLLNTFLFIGSIQLSSVANAVLLQCTAPIYVAILGDVVIGERTTRSDWICLAGILCGTSLFFFDRLTQPEMTGTIFAVLSGISVAGYTICLRSQKDNEPINIVILGSIGVFLFSLPWLFKESLSFPDVLLIAVTGSLCYGMSFILYATAIKQVRAIEALLVSTFEIVLGPIWAWIFLNEVPTKPALCGGIIILSVVLIYGCRSVATPTNSTRDRVE